ncbi:MAG TPA: hypothetical protein VME68_08850 [Acidobacteriaceae bacterium]|nr:hypothetical protein [Acidobacteriaceae bacterium]
MPIRPRASPPAALMFSLVVPPLAASPGALAQSTDDSILPVIDVHVHSMTESWPGDGPMIKPE